MAVCLALLSPLSNPLFDIYCLVAPENLTYLIFQFVADFYG
jgi:hypothetical protein